MRGLRRLFAAAMLSAGCARAQTPPPPEPAPPPRAQPAPPAQTPPAGEPDEELLEFLGSDDVGDTAWWDFLKRHPRAGTPAPPADGKQ